MTLEQSNLLSLGSLALGVLALVIAGWQVTNAKKTTNMLLETLTKASSTVDKLHALEKALTLIEGTLSTQYIDKFPDYITHTEALLSRAKQGDTVLISYILPAIAVYSDPTSWSNSQHIISHGLLTEKIKVRAVFPNNHISEEFLKKQFKNDIADWENYKVTHEKQLTQLIRNHEGQDISAKGITPDEFIKIFEEASNNAINNTYKGAQIYRVDQNLQMYLWIIEKKEAIFSIPALNPTFNAQAFWTRDTTIIAALTSLHDELTGHS